MFAWQSRVPATFTRGGLHHNIVFYVRPSDGDVLAFPWDWDFAFTASTDQPLIGTLVGGRPMSSHVRRRLYGHLLDIMNTTFNHEYLDRWIDLDDGLVAGQRLTSIKSYVAARERDARLCSCRTRFPLKLRPTRASPFRSTSRW